MFGLNKYDSQYEDKELKAVIIDWSQKGAVSSVKNQGACGAAGVFSTIGGIEGLSFVSTGHLQNFSEQQLIDCVYGCSGGFITEGYKYYRIHGIKIFI
jgi:cathepsin F